MSTSETRVDGSVLSPLEALLIERECERLITTYTQRLDLGQVDQVVDLFTDDATYEIPGVFCFQGREELTTAIPRRLSKPFRLTRHLCSNVLIKIISPDEATGVCYFVNYRKDFPDANIVEPALVEMPHYVGEYHDRFVKTVKGWRFAHRLIHLTFTDTPTA